MKPRKLTVITDEQFTSIVKSHRMLPDLLKPILKGYLNGLSNTDIAKEAGINRNTVNKYLYIFFSGYKEHSEHSELLIYMLWEGINGS